MYALREALDAFRRAPMLTGLSAAMIALSLFVVGLFGLVAYNVREVIERVESRVQVVAYLRDDAVAGEVNEAQRQVAGFSEVASVQYVSREDALANARAEMGELSGSFGTLESNPFPASLEISLKTGQAGAEAVRGVADRTRAFAIVEDVRYGDDWIDRIYVLRRVAGMATLALGIGFAAVAALIIGAAIRMAVFARRDEITIMRLVGATDAFVRRPFIIEGMITGIIGAFLAVLLTWLVFRSLGGSPFEIDWIPTGWLFGGIAAGALLGLLSSMVAVRRHLREIV